MTTDYEDEIVTMLRDLNAKVDALYFRKAKNRNFYTKLFQMYPYNGHAE